MRVVDISQFENSVVIHFDTEDNRINAYTLASTLVSLADAAKAANNTLNCGYEIEIVVEALGPGSFRAKIRAVYTSSKNLFAKEVLLGVVIGVLGNYIYERTLSVDNKVIVEVKTDEVIVQKGQDRVVIPRNVYDATRKAEKNPNFVKAMSKTFETIASDEKINGIGLVAAMDSPPPNIIIPKMVLQQMATNTPEDPDARVIYEQVDLQIIKAILDKSKRKWEFMWRGIKISAPVVYQPFYVNFFAHEITIAIVDPNFRTIV
ncbi:hypothetical protein [Geobacter sp.]|uniref:hypothetical protein n=1 Tax=Geobacter sp. TaxID=46610 RepID=UPI001AD14C75|nr:hypothetical protein [Geobacter sp.]CAG1004128.1 hypothetical protein ANRL4_03417 [Anaerolineae bacterium]